MQSRCEGLQSPSAQSPGYVRGCCAHIFPGAKKKKKNPEILILSLCSAYTYVFLQEEHSLNFLGFLGFFKLFLINCGLK